MANTPKIPQKLIEHGDERIDNYFWMRERDSKPVLAYLRAENARSVRTMKSTETLQRKLVKEMRSRIKEDEASIPIPNGPYSYYSRFVKGGEYPIYARKKGGRGKEEVLLDGNRLAKGQEYFHIGGVWESTDHGLIAYAVDTVGRRFYDIAFKDMRTGKTLEDRILGTSGGFVWANDNRTVFFVRQDPETLRAHQLFRYEIGSGRPAELVFDEEDETYHLGIDKGRTDKWLFLTSAKRDSAEVRILLADEPKGKWQVYCPRSPDFEYWLEDGGDEFFIFTNWQAPNYRILRGPTRPMAAKDWQEIVSHDPAVYLESLDVYATHMVVHERTGGLTRLSVIDRKNKSRRVLDFPDPAYIVDIAPLAEYKSEAFRFFYSSMRQPPTIYEENFTTLKRRTLKVKEVPGFKAKSYEARRLWAVAKDGTRVPVSIVFKKNLKLNGENPLLIDGYGSYGICNDPEFHRNIFSLVDRGFVYAVAHIRGGAEMGRAWYDGGRLRNKMNTFTDYIAVAEHLISEKYTNPKHLYIWGGSAGGLLIGATLNLRPDLFNGAVAAVPFVDVVTTMLDDQLPLTTAEYREWGDPRQRDDYFYMKSYSPYDNLRATDYPAVMVTTGYHDSQVQYWEPAKWVAKMRELKTDDRLLLMYTEMNAGHSGASGRFQALKIAALEYAFFLKLEGIKR